VKRLVELVAPGGLLLLAAIVFLRPGALPDPVRPYVRAYPYVVLAVGVVLGWVFNRSRIVFALLILALADRALVQFAAGEAAAVGAGRIVFNAVALLLPLNLLGCAVITERGVLTLRGLARLIPILLQLIAIAVICLPDLRDLAAWLEYRFVATPLTAWTSIAQPALVAYSLAFILQGVRFIRHQNAIDSGFLWALVASFIGLHGNRWGWPATNAFATAGLIFIVALHEMSYRMAYHDELTGLPARRAMNEALLKLGGQYAVAMVDIDHFKQFNDRYGHDVGDQALRMVASRLAGVSGGGKAFRYGGEEFAVIFPGKSAAQAIPHLESLRKTVGTSAFVLRNPGRPRKKPEKPKPASGTRHAVFITISVGVAAADDRRASPHQVIKAADRALYRAKNAGRDQVKK
jgi:diguanylate cyclase (GGDEF)-like protein